MKNAFFRLALVAVLVVIPVATGRSQISVPKTIHQDTRADQLRPSLARLPLAFEPNLGQADTPVRFVSRAPGYAMFLTDAESVLVLGADESTRGSRPVLRIRWIGGEAHPGISGLKQLPGRSNYYRGHTPAAWQTSVPQYS